MGHGNVGSENDDWLTWWMHCSNVVTEADMELTIFFEVCSNPTENLILRLVPAIEVSNDDALLVVQRVQVFETRKFLDWILELLLHVLNKCISWPLAAVFLLRYLPVPDDLQGRVLGDVIGGCNRRFDIAIDFGEYNLTRVGERFFHLICGLVEDRLKKITKSTPIGVEIDYN